MTEYKPTDHPTALKDAAEILRRGGLVAFPTETVYGLGADAMNADACRRIYTAKGRPGDNPLIIHISDMEMLSLAVADKDEVERAKPLIDAFWPGPLTLIFKKSGLINEAVNGGQATVAVRMPGNAIALALIEEAGIPIAAPSANLSGRPSPTTAAHVQEDLDGRIDMILDGGPADVGLESTIVDMSTPTPTLLRPGYITLEMLEELLGPVSVACELTLSDSEAPKAPGMKYKHYAPNAKLTLVKAKRAVRAAKYIREKIKGSPQKTAVIAPETLLSKYRGLNTYTLTAKNLFSALRKLDEDGVEQAFVHPPEETGIGRALLNRLTKASGGNIIDLDTVLFVCTGNTCRSPMAEAVWENFNTGCRAKSRGIAVMPGGAINENSAKALEGLGLSLNGHIPSPLTDSDIEEASVILTMTKAHAEHIKQRAANHSSKVFTLAKYAGLDEDVPDPFGADLAVYKHCAETIEKLISKIIENRAVRAY